MAWREAEQTTDIDPASYVFHDAVLQADPAHPLTDLDLQGDLWVIRTARKDDLIFAEVITREKSGFTIIPFREIDGRMLRTLILPVADHGEVVIEHGDRVTLAYYEVDQPYTNGLLTYLEAAYEILISGWEIEEPPLVRVVIHPSFGPLNLGLFEGIQIDTESPYLWCCPEGGLNGYVAFRDILIGQLKEALIREE
jgi:hypothetical protein